MRNRRIKNTIANKRRKMHSEAAILGSSLDPIYPSLSFVWI